MSDQTMLLLKANLKQLRLPAMSAEYAKLARDAATANEGYPEYLLRLTELEVAARSANALKARIKQAGFPVLKDFDTYDFSALAHLSKPKILELSRGEWIDQHANCCLVGNPGMVTYCYTSLCSWNKRTCEFDCFGRGPRGPSRAA
jgi:DNA replication protein DnaC